MTGLSTHVIRVWEKRYGAVNPERTESNRRLYSSDEIERLTLLRLATSAGHSIGNVARLPTEELRNLAGNALSQSSQKPSGAPRAASGSALCDPYITEAMDAVMALDSEKLDRVLGRASLDLTQPILIQEVLVPLIHQIGESWQTGRLRVVHEHVASAAIRTFVGNFVRQHSTPSYAPTLVVTTPAGQVHELGAILVAAAANNLGWRVNYLGPSLPAEEIANAVVHSKARAVALSIVYPEDDPHLDGELVKLRELLPVGTVILVGGRAATNYTSSIEKIKAVTCQSITEVSSALAQLRAGPR